MLAPRGRWASGSAAGHLSTASYRHDGATARGAGINWSLLETSGPRWHSRFPGWRNGAEPERGKWDFKRGNRQSGRTGDGGREEYKETEQEQAAAVFNRRVPPSTIKASHQPLGHLRWALPIAAKNSPCRGIISPPLLSEPSGLCPLMSTWKLQTGVHRDVSKQLVCLGFSGCVNGRTVIDTRPKAHGEPCSPAPMALRLNSEFPAATRTFDGWFFQTLNTLLHQIDSNKRPVWTVAAPSEPSGWILCPSRLHQRSWIKL